MNQASAPLLFDELAVENDDFLRTQLITYIGNKRSLLTFIDNAIVHVKRSLKKDKISFLDLFSGSGVVARMARQHCHALHCNDLELYSSVVNTCYQSNFSTVDHEALDSELRRLDHIIKSTPKPNFIAELYAPDDDEQIKPHERVFYTRRNAVFLDTFCQAIEETPSELRPFVLAPVISQASMHANTSGVFKGFYKNKEGIGQFGGTGKNALTRILRPINVQKPVFSIFECESFIHNEDANTLAKSMDHVDIAYFDPPYNQHPYGSNYFMLNLLCKYERPHELSRISGIPKDWNRSAYNKPQSAKNALFSAVENINADFVLISYNSEGFISYDDFIGELSKLGELSVMDTKYNTFRGCRNLSGRDIHVTEFLFLLDKR